MKKLITTIVTSFIVAIGYAQPYLPLTAGSSNAVTGNLFLNADTYHYANMRFANGSGLYGDNSNHPDWLVTSSGWSTNGSINAATLSLAGTLSGTSATFSGDFIGNGGSYKFTSLPVNSINAGIKIQVLKDNVNVDALNIDYLSNVGIGTTNPIAKLQINTASGQYAMFGGQSLGITNGHYTGIALGYGETGGYIKSAIVQEQVGDGAARGKIHFLNDSNADGNNVVLGDSKMTIDYNGNVGIGTTSPDSKLTVAGKIHSQEVKVTVNAGADFVFDDGYKLRPLVETEHFIKANKHLPEIASAEEMKKNGLELGEMNIKLLQKIEELTLHLIEQNKMLIEQSKASKAQEEKIRSLQEQVNRLETKL